MQNLIEHLQRSLGGAYHIERELGGGGMSRVFLAEDVALHRRVVVKVLPQELAAGVNADRFKREILLAAQLQHPHIVPVLSASEADGLPYFTMPYVSGQSLRERLDGSGDDSAPQPEGLPISEAVGILRDIARALAFAHRHGVVHRDIKPGNVLLAGGSAAVTDFGIAKAIASAREAEGDNLTQAGSSLGTPAYMAPEQAAADPAADHRVDIYAFGAVAYEVLAGHPPFHGRPPHELLRAHLIEDPIPVQRVRPSVPAPLAALVMQCLEKSPDARPQRAEEILDAMAQADLTSSRAALALPRSRRRRAVLIAAAAAAVAAIAAGVVWMRNRTPPAQADLVAVMPFRVTSANPQLHYLREGMLDLLAAKLTGEGGLRSAEPTTVLAAWRRAGGDDRDDLPQNEAIALARALGATKLLLGEAVGTPLRMVLSATLLGVPDGRPLSRVSVEGAPDSLAWLVDRLTLRLLAEHSPEGAQRTASLTSTSVPALRAFLEGHAKLRRGDAFNAAKDFERSLELDSTFALGGLGLRLATSWFGDPQRSARGLQIAWRERNRLSARDRALLAAVAGPRYPEESSSMEIYRAREQYLNMVPDRADAWYFLGDQLYHYGNILGIPDSERRALDAFRRASEIDSTYVVGFIHALPLAAKYRDTTLATRLERLRLEADTSRWWTLGHRWYAAVYRGDSAAARQVVDSAVAAGDFGIVNVVTQHALHEGTSPTDALRNLDKTIAAATTDAEHRGRQRFAHDLLLVAGRPGEALRMLRASADSARDPNIRILNVRDAMIGDGDSAAAVSAARELGVLESGTPTDSAGRTWQRAAIRVLEPWRLAGGDTSMTRRSLEHLRALARESGQARGTEVSVEIAMIEAMHAHVARHPTAAAAALRLDSLLRALDYSNVHYGRASLANIVAARLLEAQKNVPRALAAVRRRPLWNTASYPYLATQLREEGRIAALAGDREGAIRAYRHYLALRPDPEPAVRPQVDQVRAELLRLQRESSEQPSAR